MSLNPSPLELSALGWALTTPAVVVIVMSCGPLFVVKDDTGWRAPPVEAWALEKLTVPKFASWALWQKINKQMLGASATHSAELLASLPVCVVEKVHPALLVMANV
jgi:hypothetical protein